MGGGTGAVGRWCVNERGGGVFDAKGTEASEESGDVTRVGDSEGTAGAVMGEGKAEKGRGDGVSFDVIKCRQTRDNKSEVRGMVVLHAEIVNHQDKGNRARGVSEKTGGLGLVEIERL